MTVLIFILELFFYADGYGRHVRDAARMPKNRHFW